MSDPKPTTPPAPDDAARRAEFDSWFNENIGKILADDAKPSSPSPSPTVTPPPASSGLTMADFERFLDQREKSRQQSDSAGALKKAVDDLTARFDAREKSERRSRWFGLPFDW